jgi:peptidoglycan hydrolase-like protein with peptidoglycan-binding domain
MRDILAPIVSCVVVLYALSVLLSAGGTPSGFDFLTNQERMSSLGTQLIQMVMLQQRPPRSNDAAEVGDRDRTMKVQQALKETGFYSGPVDGVMREKTQEAIEFFQQSRHLKVTGTIDEETARELGIR